MVSFSHRPSVLSRKCSFDQALDLSGFGRYNIAMLSSSCLLILAMYLDIFGFSVVLPAAACDLGLTTSQQGLLSAVPLIGVMLSSYAWGLCADTKGRRWTLLLAMPFGAVLNLAASMAPTYASLAVLKFLSAGFTASANAAAFVLVGETTPRRHRSRFMFLMASATMLVQFFICVPTGSRKIIRKNKGKEERDLTDIVNLFKSADPEDMPVNIKRVDVQTCDFEQKVPQRSADGDVDHNSDAMTHTAVSGETGSNSNAVLSSPGAAEQRMTATNDCFTENNTEKWNYFNFATFNCKSVKRSVDGIRELCKTCDVIALQETWLLPDDIPFLSTIDTSFGYTGTSAVDTAAEILRGRPYGGVAILWKTSVFKDVSIIKCDNNRLCAIKIQTGERPIIVVSVYMPTNSRENLPEFTDCLSAWGGSLTVYTAEDVAKAIRSLTRGKSPGHDGLSIEHLQNAGPHISRLLAMLFSLCLCHSYLPPDLMKTVVVPVVKNKTGDMTDTNNYRPISLATIVAKVNNVRWSGAMSKEYRLECGVRQGGLTSPSLFNLYMDALIVELSSRHVGCHVDGVCVNNLSYADDMVLLSASFNNAFRSMLGLPRCCSASGMFAEARVADFPATMRARGAALVRRNAIDALTTENVAVMGDPIERVVEANNLGLLMDGKLSFENHILKVQTLVCNQYDLALNDPTSEPLVLRAVVPVPNRVQRAPRPALRRACARN
ncbi:uncharacterized protein [Choristoneura fumiferana]|uniref:uncharacterized protein n=1 Tax=Choristoneura fumiferana TaxID=7141 RepID=UPI003D1550ED